MIEIDSFKRFNDTFGHEAGDEFTLIMPETTLESAWQCAERLRESATRLQLHYNQKPLGSLTLSIGVAVFPKHGETGALALRAADEAMYQAKQAGKNRVMVSSR